METLINLINWLFIKSIFGTVLSAGIVYYIFLFSKKIFPKLPDPAIPAFTTFLIAILILPSLDRLQFEDESLSSINNKKWIKVINKAYYGAITEPLTWVHAPLGFLHFVMPNDIVTGGFTEVFLKYEEKPKIRMVDPDCKEKTILFAEPDGKGIYRYTTKEVNVMTEKEFKIFCEYDWSEEQKALNSYILNNK